MFDAVLGILYWYVRPFIKWFLRKTTKLCELQRICYGHQRGGRRTLEIEQSLRLSRTIEVKELLKHLDSLSSGRKLTKETEAVVAESASVRIVRVKKINPKLHRQFTVSFEQCILQIWGYRQLLQEIEELRLVAYDSDREDHEKKLLYLWDLLMPDVKLKSRITKQWGEIGFQGDDPKTDFRGMGMLGLENLLYFASEYNKASKHVLQHSHHPKYGYSYAIVGINLTSTAYRLLKDGTVKGHLFNTTKGRPTLPHFHQLYSCLFYEFDKFWLNEKPRDVMEFTRIHGEFEDNIRSVLKNPDTSLRINVLVNTV